MKYNRNILKKIVVAICLMGLAFCGFFVRKEVQAANKEYGVLIANKEGDYTFYDLNGEVGNQKVEISENSKIMIPLKKVCSYCEDLDYSFDFTTRKAVIYNKSTGKKLVLQENKKYAYLYGKGATKGKKVTLSEKSYISKESNALMVHISTLKYICKNTTGYSYYGKKMIQAAGYDCSLIQGIVVYNPYQIVKELPEAVSVSYVSEKNLSNITTVTIPEGYSVSQIVKRLVEKKVCISSKALYEAMEEVDLSRYAMFDSKQVDDTVCFQLEGYLYPDTYEFYKNSEPSQVINTILDNANKKLLSYAKQADDLGYTLDDILSIASIIEKETGVEGEMPKVSSVLHTRLSRGKKLQCDATIHYIEKYVKSYITGNINRYNEYYNTYKCKTLPAGPICNPSKKAIQAALSPDDTPYLYFATDDEGIYYYAKDDNEWTKMKKDIAKRNDEIKEAKENSDQ